MLKIKSFTAVVFLLIGSQLLAQKNKLPQINRAEVERIEATLASDDMEGRKTFTPGIDKAADFIAAEFKKSGIKIFENNENYFQKIFMLKANTSSIEAKINNKLIAPENVMLFSSLENLEVNKISAYKILTLDSSKNIVQQALSIFEEKENIIVRVPEALASGFKNLKRFNRQSFEKKFTVIFILGDEILEDYNFKFTQEIKKASLKNVIGYLPGKSKKDEFVIFSAHYDHLGIGKPNAAGDSIFNGANDDAAGTTAVISLANYFSKLKNNERSIIFVAFTAEEMGGFGSQFFSENINPEKIAAMFNIEMIGTHSKWGANSAYITGFEKSDFGTILQQNLVNSKFKFEPDPYPTQQLFYRSDNARLAAMGVPAHSISTAKMDDEPFYHKQGDEVSTLDMENMAAIIEAIALSSQTIINGKDTPTRVEKK